MLDAFPEIDHGTPPSAATEQVTLQIDGHSVTVPAGTSLMRAGVLAGYILAPERELEFVSLPESMDTVIGMVPTLAFMPLQG